MKCFFFIYNVIIFLIKNKYRQNSEFTIKANFDAKLGDKIEASTMARAVKKKRAWKKGHHKYHDE